MGRHNSCSRKRGVSGSRRMAGKNKPGSSRSPSDIQFMPASLYHPAPPTHVWMRGLDEAVAGDGQLGGWARRVRMRPNSRPCHKDGPDLPNQPSAEARNKREHPVLRREELNRERSPSDPCTSRAQTHKASQQADSEQGVGEEEEERADEDEPAETSTLLRHAGYQESRRVELYRCCSRAQYNRPGYY